MLTGSRKDAKPSMSRRTGRMGVVSWFAAGGLRSAAAGEVVVELVEESADAVVLDTGMGAVLREQLCWCLRSHLDCAHPSRARLGEILVDVNLECVRERLEDVLAEPGVGGLLDPHAQVVLAVGLGV